jgi:hypothetical protein
MRRDLPPELVASIAKLPPGLREAAERAADAQYPTFDEETAERHERERRQRLDAAVEQRELAALAARALDGEWGDDIRRAVDVALGETRPQVLVLADWARRAAKREALTRIEFAAAKLAFESASVRYGLARAKKVIHEAERDRRKAAVK